MKYELYYWLHNQSKLFSEPQHYETNSREEFFRALAIAEDNGYEIEKVVS